MLLFDVRSKMGCTNLVCVSVSDGIICGEVPSSSFPVYALHGFAMRDNSKLRKKRENFAKLELRRLGFDPGRVAPMLVWSNFLPYTIESLTIWHRSIEILFSLHTLHIEYVLSLAPHPSPHSLTLLIPRISFFQLSSYRYVDARMYIIIHRFTYVKYALYA